MTAASRSPATAAPDMTVRFCDHLFLANDHNHVNDQHKGDVQPLPYRKSRWLGILTARADAVRKMDIPFRFLVAPDKQTVYRHILPPAYAHRAADFLRQLPFTVDVAPLLRSLSPLVDVYPPTDSHWNHLGGYVAAQSVLLSLGLPTLEITPRWRDWHTEGDLGRKLMPPVTGPRLVADYDARSSLIFDNGVGNNGRIRVFSKPNDNNNKATVVLVFSDSFGYELIEFLKEAFDVCIQIHAMSMDIDLVKAVAPDFVVNELTERFVFRLPSPADGHALHLIWAEKLLKGERPMDMSKKTTTCSSDQGAVTLDCLRRYGGGLFILNERVREEGALGPEDAKTLCGLVVKILAEDPLGSDVDTAARLAQLAAALFRRFDIPVERQPLLAIVGQLSEEPNFVHHILTLDGGALPCLEQIPGGLRPLVLEAVCRIGGVSASAKYLVRRLTRQQTAPMPALDAMAVRLLRQHAASRYPRVLHALVERLSSHPHGCREAYIVAAEALAASGDLGRASDLTQLYLDDFDHDARSRETRRRFMPETETLGATVAKVASLPERTPADHGASDAGRYREQVYKSSNYSIFCDRAGKGRQTVRSRTIFVSFPMRDDCNSAFGEVVFAKNDIDVVYVTTTDGNWFQYDDTEQAARAIAEVVRGYGDVVAYGTSMGGFGALAFSGLIGATVVISCSPQYSIDPRKTPFESRYTADSLRIQGSCGFLHDDLGKTLSKSARLVLLFDPLDEKDGKHAKLVEEHRAAERLPVPFSGHKSLATLREMGLVSELVKAAASGRLDLGKLRKEMRNRRWQSPTYLRFLARALNKKKLPGVAEAIGAAAQLPGPQTWDALRNDVRFASEHGAQELAVGQFSKLVQIGSYVAKYMFVTDFYRWSSALLNSESRPATRSVLFELLFSNRRAVSPQPTSCNGKDARVLRRVG